MNILKKWATTVLASLCAIFTALAAIFPVAAVYGITLNGFDALSNANGYAEPLITGIFAILCTVGGVGLLALVVIKVITKKGKLALVPIISFVLTLVYLIMTVAVLGMVGNLGYIPFILVAVFSIGYFVCDKLFAK